MREIYSNDGCAMHTLQATLLESRFQFSADSESTAAHLPHWPTAINLSPYTDEVELTE